MPSKLTFTSVVLLGFGRTVRGGKAHFSASFTKDVRDALGWNEVADGVTGATLEGDLAASTAELVPQDKELTMHRMGLELSRVHKFEVVRLELEGKKGKGYRIELRFVVQFTDDKGAAKLERYIQTIGEGKGKLTVSYTKQEALPGMAEEPTLTDEQKAQAAGEREE